MKHYNEISIIFILLAETHFFLYFSRLDLFILSEPFISRFNNSLTTESTLKDNQTINQVKRPWCWERLRSGGEGDDRASDGWMASPTQWTCVWVDSRSWWWTGRPAMLQFMGSQRIGYDWGNWTEPIWFYPVFPFPDMILNRIEAQTLRG